MIDDHDHDHDHDMAMIMAMAMTIWDWQHHRIFCFGNAFTCKHIQVEQTPEKSCGSGHSPCRHLQIPVFKCVVFTICDHEFTFMRCQTFVRSAARSSLERQRWGDSATTLFFWTPLNLISGVRIDLHEKATTRTCAKTLLFSVWQHWPRTSLWQYPWPFDRSILAAAIRKHHLTLAVTFGHLTFANNQR